MQDGLSVTVNVLLPVLAQLFGLGYAQVGLLRGAMNLVQALVEMGSGWVSEVLGESETLVVGLLFTGMGYVLMSFASGIFLVTAGLLVVGVGTALHHAPSSSLIASNFPPGKRSSALGLYNASGDIGKLVLSGGFSLALGAGLAWHQTSLCYAGLSLLAAIAVAAISSQLRFKARKTEHALGEKSNTNGTSRWGVLNWRSFSILLATISIDNMIQASVLVFTAFLMLSKGLPIWLSTGATVLLLAGGVAGKAACGFLADRLGVRAAYSVIQGLTALGLVLVVIAPNWLVAVLLIPLGAVVQGSTSITYGFAAGLIHPKRMARGYALLYASGSFTAALGPPLFGLVGDATAIGSAFYLMAGVILLAIPMIFLLPESSPDRGR
ncbi:MAG: MFS transporter [Rhizobiaceae bacterium]